MKHHLGYVSKWGHQLLREKILVADDEFDVRSSTKMILENNGYKVSLAVNGLEALQKAENELPDLIILNVIMPVKSGWSVCEILKSQEKTKRIPIVICTVLPIPLDERSRRFAEEAGADGYLPKPYNADELLAVTKKYLTQRVAAA